MNIQDLNPQQYVDLFGGDDVQKQPQANFGSEIVDVDLLGGGQKKDDSSLNDKVALATSSTEQTTVDPNLPKEGDEIKDVDLLGSDDNQSQIRLGK